MEHIAQQTHDTDTFQKWVRWMCQRTRTSPKFHLDMCCRADQLWIMLHYDVRGRPSSVRDSTARQLNIQFCDIGFPSCLYKIFGKGPMDLIIFLKGIFENDTEVWKSNGLVAMESVCFGSVESSRLGHESHRILHSIVNCAECLKRNMWCFLMCTLVLLFVSCVWFAVDRCFSREL